MDKIDMEMLHVDKDQCDKITITSPERVHIKNNNTDGNFAEFPSDCVLTVTDQASGIILEYIRVDAENDSISLIEERKLREENIFVSELYEEYRVALILAHGG